MRRDDDVLAGEDRVQCHRNRCDLLTALRFFREHCAPREMSTLKVERATTTLTRRRDASMGCLPHLQKSALRASLRRVVANAITADRHSPRRRGIGQSGAAEPATIGVRQMTVTPDHWMKWLALLALIAAAIVALAPVWANYIADAGSDYVVYRTASC